MPAPDPRPALRALLLSCLAAALGLQGCPNPDDDDTADDDSAGDDDGGDDDGGDDDDSAEVANEWGFPVRLPRTRTLACGADDVEFQDTDWLCTFAHGETSGVVYARSTPTDCVQVSDWMPVYESLAWISTGGDPEPIALAAYDHGGNHNNDWLDVDLDGHRYRYYHSSFGFGWRKCQPMDCLQVWDASGTDLLEDGCTCDRALPVTCSQVQADGSWEDLVDDFAVCAGDPECGE